MNQGLNDEKSINGEDPNESSGGGSWKKFQKLSSGRGRLLGT